MLICIFDSSPFQSNSRIEQKKQKKLYSNFDGFIPLKVSHWSLELPISGMLTASFLVGLSTNQIFNYPDAVVSLCPQGNLIFFIRYKTAFCSVQVRFHA